jgi:hypothetical protein
MSDSEWLNPKGVAAELPGKRSPRFAIREIKAGRLRAARIGGRGEYVIHRTWLRQYLEDQSTPVMVTTRRRA